VWSPQGIEQLQEIFNQANQQNFLKSAEFLKIRLISNVFLNQVNFFKSADQHKFLKPGEFLKISGLFVTFQDNEKIGAGRSVTFEDSNVQSADLYQIYTAAA